MRGDKEGAYEDAIIRELFHVRLASNRDRHEGFMTTESLSDAPSKLPGWLTLVLTRFLVGATTRWSLRSLKCRIYGPSAVAELHELD